MWWRSYIYVSAVSKVIGVNATTGFYAKFQNVVDIIMKVFTKQNRRDQRMSLLVSKRLKVQCFSKCFLSKSKVQMELSTYVLFWMKVVLSPLLIRAFQSHWD